MLLIVLEKSARSYGWDRTYSLAGDYFENGLADYGPAINEIYITACLRGGGLIDSWCKPDWEKLPIIKFYRKKARFDLEYESKSAKATPPEKDAILTLKTFNKVLQELADVLHLMDARLKKSDAFDLARFHQDISRLVAKAPKTDKELLATEKRVDKNNRKRLLAMDPWERLAVEWDDYHPDARRLLDDPFFWWEDYDYSPHGNDTGADLLGDFKKWHKRHPSKPAHQMARALLKQWDMPEIDLHMVNKPEIESLYHRDETALTVTDEAMIAVAFAAIKLRGCCDRVTRDLALNAIKRESVSAALSGQGKEDMSERIKKLDMMSDTLRNAPYDSPAAGR